MGGGDRDSAASIEAAKLAPHWNPQLAAVHAQELAHGHRNRATLAVARKRVAYLIAVDKSAQPFQLRTPPGIETTMAKQAKSQLRASGYRDPGEG